MAKKVEVKDLLEAGVHFGHLTRKWNPNMAPYIYMERNGIHVINLYKTVAKLDEAQQALKQISSSGRKILFVATKKQAKDIVAEKVADRANEGVEIIRRDTRQSCRFVLVTHMLKQFSSCACVLPHGTVL